MRRSASVVCLEAFLKVRRDAYVTLSSDGKASEKIDIFHSCASCRFPFVRTSGNNLRSLGGGGGSGDTLRSGVSRAKGGGADRDRTDDLLNAIQALSQLSYGPTQAGLGDEGKGKSKKQRRKSQIGKGDPWRGNPAASTRAPRRDDTCFSSRSI